ncbi:hypothetical protein [Paenibacillus sp. FSL H7-0323]|uniref:hypothetical protein n=1 Tax=Paenibacillus sp. FSL H7-0323 TaxID=2921433 RepID=UPI0030F5E8EA
MKKVHFLLIVMVIIFLWGASWYFIPTWYGKTELEAGTFGDMFGAVNALFSGLAFAGLIYTILLQREDLKIQRKSFDNQFKELQHQVENTKRQLELTKYQSYQDTLRYLFQVKAKAIENIKYYKWDEESGHVKLNRSGYDFIDLFYQAEESNIQKKFNREKYNFPRYFQIYKQILQFIVEVDVSPDQKKNLQDILNVETSDSEVCLIYVLNKYDQHMMFLMQSNGLEERYKTIINSE